MVGRTGLPCTVRADRICSVQPAPRLLPRPARRGSAAGVPLSQTERRGARPGHAVQGIIDLIPDIDLQASIMASTAWQRQEGRTQCLLGDVLETKNRLDEALAVFHEALAISQRLASIDPSNAGGQRDLAVAHNRLGQTYGMGNEESVQSSYRSAVEAMERAVAMSSGAVGWKQDLDNLKSWLSP